MDEKEEKDELRQEGCDIESDNITNKRKVLKHIHIETLDINQINNSEKLNNKSNDILKNKSNRKCKTPPGFTVGNESRRFTRHIPSLNLTFKNQDRVSPRRVTPNGSYVYPNERCDISSRSNTSQSSERMKQQVVRYLMSKDFDDVISDIVTTKLKEKNDQISSNNNDTSEAESDEEDEYDENVKLLNLNKHQRILRSENSRVMMCSTLVMVVLGCRIIIGCVMESLKDGYWGRMLDLVFLPVSFVFMLFALNMVLFSFRNIFGSVAHVHSNSMYYSVEKPKAKKAEKERLPDITVQMPVYKEDLEEVIKPSLLDIMKAADYYRSKGGNVNLFVNDDGINGGISEEEKDERRKFYKDYNVAYVARPPHSVFRRRGRFKKASNMNYALQFVKEIEDYLEDKYGIKSLDEVNDNTEEEKYETIPTAPPLVDLKVIPTAPPLRELEESNSSVDENISIDDTNISINDTNISIDEVNINVDSIGDECISQDKSRSCRSNETSWMLNQSDCNNINHGDNIYNDDIENNKQNILNEAIEWVKINKFNNDCEAGGPIRIGELILLVDSDTRIPKKCMYEVISEFDDPIVGFTQHMTTPLQVVFDWWENFIANFTRLIYEIAIVYATSGGDPAPLVGHNAFLRWEYVKEVSYLDENDNMNRKYWSEDHVSEDFDMSLRLQIAGYIGRYVTFTGPGFQEGVSLTYSDEVIRFRKYAYGSSELVFNKFKDWWRKGPFSKLFKKYIFAKSVPWYAKMGMVAYLGTYFAMASAILYGFANHLMWTYCSPCRKTMIPAVDIAVTCTVVFGGIAPVATAVYRYRLSEDAWWHSMIRAFRWWLCASIFFNSLFYHLSISIVAHLFDIDMSWGATVKTLDDTNFHIEMKNTWKAFKDMYIFMFGYAIVYLVMYWLPGNASASSDQTFIPFLLNLFTHTLGPIVLNPRLMRFYY